MVHAKQKAAWWPPFSCSKKLLHHFDAVDVDHVSRNCAGDGDMMAFVSSEFVGVVDGKDLVIAIGDDDHLLPGADALLGTGNVLIVGALGAALGVADVSVDGGHIGGEDSDCGKQHRKREQDQQ